MEKTHFHVNEDVRNAIIVIAIFSVIALISYLQWSGKLD